MLEKTPTREEMVDLIGAQLFDIWNQLCELIDAKYEMDHIWNAGGKAWKYEYKYRRGGKTMCALYAKENCFGFMVILGKYEREKFEADKEAYADEVQRIYEQAHTYHDGKWLMLELTDTSLFCDMERLLFIKRKPNKQI